VSHALVVWSARLQTAFILPTSLGVRTHDATNRSTGHFQRISTLWITHNAEMGKKQSFAGIIFSALLV
jgi:hypothetical protein